MQLNKKLFTGIVMIGTSAALLLSSCNKKSDSTAASTPKVVNTLCEGNGSSSYYPLVKGNSWKYNYTMAGIKQSSPTVLANSTKVFNGKTYMVMIESSGFLFLEDQYYREDAANHNIYVYYEAKDSEYLEVPNTPTLNQSWKYLKYTRKVTSLSASISTTKSSCGYSGLLEITEYDGAVFRKKMYYKKGLGFLYRQEPGFVGSDEFLLSEVTLK